MIMPEMLKLFQCYVGFIFFNGSLWYKGQIKEQL